MSGSLLKLRFAALMLSLLAWHGAVAQEPILLADRFLARSPNETRVVRIVGKFQSPEAMREHLRLDWEFGRLAENEGLIRGRPWTLRDVLVSMDLNASGDVAIWTVAGPRSLISAYVDYLQAGSTDRTLFYDFGVSGVPFRFAAD